LNSRHRAWACSAVLCLVAATALSQNTATSATGVWTNVTPANAAPDNTSLDCSNFGTQSVQADTSNPGTVYTEFNCQGIWKSLDYGLTWAGPINTGTNGRTVGDCAGGITVSPHAAAGGKATIYESCIRGGALNAVGFWKSVDGGVNWVRYALRPLPADRQDVYAPVVDPYDRNHLLMAGHEQNVLIQSSDGGKSWSAVALNAGMSENGGTAAIFFIDTGVAPSTRLTWLWMAQQSGGIYGTWRTADGGVSWAKVDNNEHPHGGSQIYQPDSGGGIYMAGAYSTHGWGVLRSTDYGKSWTHVGGTGNESAVFGTQKNISAMLNTPAQGNPASSIGWETSPQPGTGTWTNPSPPAGLGNGPGCVAVMNDGSHYILLGAMWGVGLWRYVEP
jgi:photosystem II stability/assembly factor-like uncharacterized protein